MLKRIVAAGLFVVSLGGVAAQQVHAEEATTRLKEVVVTATRTEKDPQDVTQSVTVITSEQIQRSSAQTVAEAINSASGIRLMEYGGKGAISGVNIRGANSEQVVVLLDGRRMNSASAGGFDMANISVPLEDIDRIEIVRGASSALYGADAVGGVVNIITKKPSGPSTTVSAEAGSHGYQNYGASTESKMGKAYYRLSGSRELYDGFRENSDLDKWTASAKLGYDISADSSIELSLDSLGKEVGVPGSLTYPSPQARQWDRDLGSSLTYRTKFSKELDVRLNLYQNRDDIRYTDPNPLFPTASEHRSTSTGGEFQTNWLAASWSLLTLGADVRQDHINSNTAGVHTASLTGVYLQDELSIGDSLIVVVGARNDSHSVYGSRVSPKVSARYRLSSTGTIFRASAGEAFRAPTLNELFWPFDGMSQGNAGLKPETSKEYEAGVEQPFGTGNSLRFTYFERRLNNMIQWQLDPATFIYSPVNLGQARVTGSESEATFVPFTGLTWSVNYTYLNAKDRLTGGYIPGIPASQVKSYVNVTLPSKTVIYVEGRYVKNYMQPAPTPNPTREYTVADAKITQPVQLGQNVKADLFAGIKNMFDRQYQVSPGYPMPPKEVFGGVSMRF